MTVDNTTTTASSGDAAGGAGRRVSLLGRNYAMPTRWGFEKLGWGVKVCWLAAHVLCVGIMLVLDSDLRRQTLHLSWIAACYYVLLILTVVQYSFTAGSSPGYVVDALQQDPDFEEKTRTALDSSPVSNAPSVGRANSATRAVTNGGAAEGARNGQSVQIPISETTPLLAPSSGSQPQGKSSSRVSFCNDAVFYNQPSFPTESSIFLVWGFLPAVALIIQTLGSCYFSTSGPWRCYYCHVIQPFRTKHCHDCDKCVLRFDHHCVWLGTCVGQSNHLKFWWFVFLETILVLWTAIIYGSAMNSNGTENWLLHDTIVLAILLGLIACLAFLITLLIFHTYLAVTNQTTYEKTRRRRIAYLRNIPDGMYPFSKGCISNVQSFCCTPSNTPSYIYTLTQEDIEAARDRRCCG